MDIEKQSKDFAKKLIDDFHFPFSDSLQVLVATAYVAGSTNEVVKTNVILKELKKKLEEI